MPCRSYQRHTIVRCDRKTTGGGRYRLDQTLSLELGGDLLSPSAIRGEGRVSLFLTITGSRISPQMMQRHPLKHRVPVSSPKSSNTSLTMTLWQRGQSAPFIVLAQPPLCTAPYILAPA